MTMRDPVPSGPEDDPGGGDAASRELDQLFLLHATALEAGDAVARWWFELRADVQDATTPESLDKLLQSSLQGIAHALGADAVAVLVADDTGELVARTAVGLPQDVWREVHIALGTGMAGRVAAERRPWVVPDLAAIEVVSETLRDSGMRSLVAVPIIAGDRVFGVVHADSVELAAFDERDARLLSVVADRLAAAMERVALFESEREARERAEAAADRLGRLQHITATLSGDLDVDQVVDAVLLELGPEFGPDVTSQTIWVVDGDRMRLLRDWRANPEALPFAEIGLDDELPGPNVVRAGESLWMETRHEIGERFPELRDVKMSSEALAVLPLRVEAEVLGVLAIGYGASRTFTSEDKSFLAVAAQQAAQALHRARLRSARARAAADNAFLAELSAVLGASLDVETTVGAAVRLAVPALADMATIHLYDELGTLRRMGVAHRHAALELELQAGEADSEMEAVSARQTLAYAGGRVLLLPAPGADMATATALDEAHEDVLRELGISSALAVPLVARGEDIGLLGLMRTTGSVPYGSDDLSLAAEVGQRVSQAVDNALQHQRRIEVARALQASLLPPALVAVPGAEVAAVFHPATAGVDVGGDFYDLFPLDDERWVLMIGDVSGSGPAAAALTAQVRHGARVAARAGLEPAAVVAAVNATLDETTGSEWFCTMVYSELTPHADGIDMQVICAGHPPPIVLRGEHVEEVECQAPLLGVMPSATFPARRLRLGPGHALVLVTDGATEARPPTAHGQVAFFGDERVADAVRTGAGLDAQGLVDRVAAAVLEYSGGQLGDDLAIVALRAVPRPGRPA
jgi:serine phosphatase RsbU (regulator of sigma subunit)/putative methionine-R-sulfoxide reductase with GAF domain